MIQECPLSAAFEGGLHPESVKRFIDMIGYTKVEAINDVSLLEHAIREDLNLKAPRVICGVESAKDHYEKLP